jgi:hypothetical protein
MGAVPINDDEIVPCMRGSVRRLPGPTIGTHPDSRMGICPKRGGECGPASASARSMHLSWLPDKKNRNRAHDVGQRLAKARESGMRMINPTIATTITMTTTRGSLKL